MNIFENLVLTDYIMYIAVGAGSFLLAVIVVLLLVKANNTKKLNQKQEFRGEASQVGTTGEMGVRGEYYVMARGVQYYVGQQGHVLAGRYIFKNALENGDAFNMRFNGLVNEYQDGCFLHLGDGDTITAVSGSIMIKRV